MEGNDIVRQLKEISVTTPTLNAERVPRPVGNGPSPTLRWAQSGSPLNCIGPKSTPEPKSVGGFIALEVSTREVAPIVIADVIDPVSSCSV